MLSTSFEFRSLIAQNTKVEVKATLYLKRTDGGAGMRSVYLTGPDFMSGEWSFNDAVSSTGSFDVGAAIINQFEFTLNNYTRKFDDYDFTGGYIDPYVGVRLSNGNIEWLRKGRYYIEQPETYGSTIHIKALDAMCKLERPYNEVTTRYPASLRTIVMNICSKCGVTLNNSNFVNNDFVVQERPSDDSLTCLAVLAYAAQASGNWARFNNQGYLRLEWYNTAAFEGEDWLDGGTYATTTKPYSDGDTADGGNFTDYSSGDTVEGGEFGNNVYANIFAYSSASIVTDDVVITGLRVTAQDKEQEEGDDLEGETELYGSEGYVLEFPDNPLIQYGTAADVAERVGKRVVGMRFRPFDVSALGDPSIEAGDPIILTDHLQNQYRSYITTLTYKVGSYETYACNAETPSRNSASSYSAATRAVVKLRNQIEREKTDRERAIENLAEQLATSSGLYMTRQVQQDGSTIYYMHDKPTLPESKIVWKLTANAFGISTDGGKTYPYGLDVNGDAILNRIYAIGLDADYINTGALSVRDASGHEVFRADVETGTVTVDTANFKVTPQGVITATSGTIGGFTIGQSALYNGVTSLDAQTQGVYVGTDGIATSDSGNNSLRMYGGTIRGYQGTRHVGTISPTLNVVSAVDTSQVVARGILIQGQAVAFSVDKLYVKDNDGSGNLVDGVSRNIDKYFIMPNSWTAWRDFDPDGSSPVTLKMAEWEQEDVNGVMTYSYIDDTDYDAYSFYCAKQVDVKLAGKANTNHTHSGYASSTHTHSYSSLTGKPSIPKFSLSGTTLTITT